MFLWNGSLFKTKPPPFKILRIKILLQQSKMRKKCEYRKGLRWENQFLSINSRLHKIINFSCVLSRDIAIDQRDIVFGLINCLPYYSVWTAQHFGNVCYVLKHRFTAIGILFLQCPQ